MSDHLQSKLENFVHLSGNDRDFLKQIATINIRRVSVRHDLIREGDAPHFVNLVLDGWAIRHKMLEDGRRQIIAFLLPGDICDLNIFMLREMDHSIGALTPLTVAQLPRETFEEIYERYPRIAQGLLWDTLITAAIQREWTVNLGQRTAFERIAHLICELALRLQATGQCHDLRFEMPITQTDLSEAVGMTAVHINRTIQEMRAQGLIAWKGREIHIPNLEALQIAAMFNPNYLHFDRSGAHLDANA